MLVPVIGLIQVGAQGRADRYMYLPQIGLAIALAWGAAELTRNWRPLQLLCGGAFAVLLVALACCSWLQTRYWHDSITLWTHALKLDFEDRNDFAHNNLGVVLAAKGDTDKAIWHYQEAIRITPHYAEAHNNLGVTLMSVNAKGNMDAALDHFQQAVSYNPFHADAHNNLGVVLHRLGVDRHQKKKIDEAVEQFNKVLKMDPGHALACRNLGKILYDRGEVRQAISYYRRALQSKPRVCRRPVRPRPGLGEAGQVRRGPAPSPRSDRPGARQCGQLDRHRQLCLVPGQSTRRRRQPSRRGDRPGDATLPGHRPEDPRMLGILAAAQAAAGKFPEAVATAEQALALVDPQSLLAQELRRCLESYRAGKPLPP